MKQTDWGVDLASPFTNSSIRSFKDTRSASEIAHDLRVFLTEPEHQPGSQKFNERYVARTIYQQLYYLSAQDRSAVDRAYDKENYSAGGIIETINKQVPNYAESFKRLNELSKPEIPENYKVPGDVLLKTGGGLKVGEFQTVELMDQGISRSYSVFIPETVDSRGLVVMGLDGVRSDDRKNYIDLEGQLSLMARNTGAIVMIPHHRAGNLQYKPSIAGKVLRNISNMAGASAIFDKDILTDPGQRDPKLIGADKKKIQESLAQTHFWNMPESKQNLFPASKEYSDLKFVLHSWDDLRSRMNVSDHFGAFTFSNGGLVAQELQNNTDKLSAAALFMSPRIKDELPKYGTNMMLVFADADATLNPKGGAGWPRGWVMDANTKTNLRDSIPVKDFEEFSKTNRCEGAPKKEIVPGKVEYTKKTFENCKEGDLSIINVPAPYGHAIPSWDNLNLAQWSRPAPTDLAEVGFKFVIDHMRLSQK